MKQDEPKGKRVSDGSEGLAHLIFGFSDLEILIVIAMVIVQCWIYGLI